MSRPSTARTSKKALEPVLRELMGLGFGSPTIGHMLGYSDRYVGVLARDLGVKRNDDIQCLAQAVVRLLRPGLRDSIYAIKARNEIYWSGKKRVNGRYDIARWQEVPDVDEDKELCDDHPRKGAPAADVPAIPSLADLLR